MRRRTNAGLTALQAALAAAGGGFAGYSKDSAIRSEEEERKQLKLEREMERKARDEERKQLEAERIKDRAAADARFNAQQKQWAFGQGLEERSALDRAVKAPGLAASANAAAMPEGWKGKPMTFDGDWFKPIAEKAEQTLARGRKVDLPMAEGSAAFYQPYERTPEGVKEAEEKAKREAEERRAKEKRDEDARYAALQLQLVRERSRSTGSDYEDAITKKVMDAVAEGVIEEVPVDPKYPALGTRKVRRNLTPQERQELQASLREAAGLSAPPAPASSGGQLRPAAGGDLMSGPLFRPGLEAFNRPTTQQPAPRPTPEVDPIDEWMDANAPFTGETPESYAQRAADAVRRSRRTVGNFPSL